MPLKPEQKRSLFNISVEITKQAVQNMTSINGVQIAEAFEKIYVKLKEVAEKDDF